LFFAHIPTSAWNWSAYGIFSFSANVLRAVAYSSSRAFRGANSPAPSPSLTGLADRITGRAPASLMRATIVPMFETNLSVGVPLASFIPNSTDTTVGFHPATS